MEGGDAVDEVGVCRGHAWRGMWRGGLRCEVCCSERNRGQEGGRCGERVKVVIVSPTLIAVVDGLIASRWSSGGRDEWK